MNDRLQYEEELASRLNDLPLPDENMAWEDMKRRLEEDDDDGAIIPYWLRGCGLWVMLAVILVVIGWWLIRPEKRRPVETNAGYVTNTIQRKQSQSPAGENNMEENDSVHRSKSKENNLPYNVPGRTATDDHRNSSANRKPEIAFKKIKKKPALNQFQGTNRREQKTRSSGYEITGEKIKPITPGRKRGAITEEDAIKLPETIKTADSVRGFPKSKVNSTDTESRDGFVPGSDSSLNFVKDTAKLTTQEQISKEVLQIKDSSKSTKISFAAGLAIQQQIPVNGQKLTPYNSLGRKGSLADYIPSVYLRMYKNDKWFLQLEFRYGAPQNTKEITYGQKSVSDSIGGQQYTTTASNKLKKTYYHQLPLTFNYYIRPNWSLGTGIAWNKFFSAVYERETIRRNDLTAQDSIIGKIILQETPGTDSASVFSKNYFQAVFETQYSWKRFSLGARYSFGLNPYIKFNLPGMGSGQEKNSSLQVFLRYELWRSKK